MIRPFFRSPYRISQRGWIAERIFTLSNFAGGFNNVGADTVIGDNEFTDTKNMRFVGNELMEKRPGIAEVNAESYAALSSPITWIDEYRPTTGASSYIYATDSAVYVNGTKLCDVEGRVRGVNYIGKYYFVDGHHLYAYDGSTYYKVQSEPFSYLTQSIKKNDTSFTVEEIPSTVAVGDKVWFAKNIVDGSASENYINTIKSIDHENKKITVASGFSVSITIPEGGFAKYPVSFYEPKSGTRGEEVWDAENHAAYYKPCLSELEDSFHGNSYIPDSPNVIVVHCGRLFVSGDSKSPNGVFLSVWDSRAPVPIYFPAGCMNAVKPNGKPIVDMVVFDDALIVGRNEDIYVLYGNSEYPSTVVSGTTQFSFKQMDVSTGFMNTGCGALINNYYVYLGYDGRFYALNTPTTYVEYLMTRPLSWKCDVYGSPFNIPQNTQITISTVAYRNEVYFCINNDFVIVYNYDNMSYTYFTGWKAACLYTDGLKLFIGRTDGKFAAWCDGNNLCYNDCGSAIKCKLSTKRFDLDLSASYKYFKRFMLTTHAYLNYNSNIQVDFEIDYYQKNDSEDFVVPSNVGRFGISKWGKAVFGNREFLKSGWIDLDVRGRTIKFDFSNEELNEPMRIYDLNVIWGIRDVR